MTHPSSSSSSSKHIRKTPQNKRRFSEDNLRSQQSPNHPNNRGMSNNFNTGQYGPPSNLSSYQNNNDQFTTPQKSNNQNPHAPPLHHHHQRRIFSERTHEQYNHYNSYSFGHYGPNHNDQNFTKEELDQASKTLPPDLQKHYVGQERRREQHKVHKKTYNAKLQKNNNDMSVLTLMQKHAEGERAHIHQRAAADGQLVQQATSTFFKAASSVINGKDNSATRPSSSSITESIDDRDDDTNPKKRQRTDDHEGLRPISYKTACNLRETLMTIWNLASQGKLQLRQGDVDIVKEFASQHKEELHKIVHVNTPLTKEEIESVTAILNELVDLKYQDEHQRSVIKNEILKASTVPYEERHTLYLDQRTVNKPPLVQVVVQNIQALTKENEGLKNTVKNKEEMIQKQKNYQVIEKKNYKEELDRAIERSRSESKELLDSKDSTIGTKDEVILVLKDLLDAKDEKIKSLKSKIKSLEQPNAKETAGSD